MVEEASREPASQDLGEVVESSWAERAEPLSLQERLFEATLTGAAIVVAIALALLAPHTTGVHWQILPVVVGYALAWRVHYPVGRMGYLVPTQPLLVVLFALAPVAYVPLLVVAGIALGVLIGAREDSDSFERLLCMGGDAAHSLGPTAVILAAGYTTGIATPPLLWIAAFGAQLVCDVGFSSLRAWVAYGQPPGLEIRVFSRIAGIDAALTPLGLLASVASRSWAWAPIGLLPAVALLDAARRERSARIERAHRRTLELERERERLTVAIQRIGEALAHDLTLDGLLGIVTQASVEVLDASAGRASVAEIDRSQLTRRIELLDAPAFSMLLEHTERASVLAGESTSCDDGNGTFALGCPVGSGEMIVGVVTLARSSEFSEFERSLLVYLCGQAEVAAVNVLRHEAVRRQALTDELTGLANHRHLQNRLDQVLDSYLDHSACASLILLDIDNFKRFNDQHGHQVGDEVLAAVGRCLQQNSRDTDLAARYGGEELALLLPGATLATASAIAERLRRDVEGVGDAAFEGRGIRVTASLGVAELSGAIGNPSDLIRAADMALYRAKREGKNRVCLASGAELSLLSQPASA